MKGEYIIMYAIILFICFTGFMLIKSIGQQPTKNQETLLHPKLESKVNLDEYVSVTWIHKEKLLERSLKLDINFLRADKEITCLIGTQTSGMTRYAICAEWGR